MKKLGPSVHRIFESNRIFLSVMLRKLCDGIFCDVIDSLMEYFGAP